MSEREFASLCLIIHLSQLGSYEGAALPCACEGHTDTQESRKVRVGLVLEGGYGPRGRLTGKEEPGKHCVGEGGDEVEDPQARVPKMLDEAWMRPMRAPGVVGIEGWRD